MCTYVILVHILKKIGVPDYINWVIHNFVGGDNNVGRSVEPVILSAHHAMQMTIKSRDQIYR